MHLLQFDSEQAWVGAIAALWRDRLRTNPRLRMCLPSGHTPLKIFDAMGRSVVQGQASFARAEIFSLDEYGGLAPDDPGRCANMLRRYLLDCIDLPAANFHAIDTTSPDVDRVCAAYDNAIGDGFDLTLLGIGVNGHLGLNEPGSPVDGTTQRFALHDSTIKGSAKYLTHSNLPTWGIGVGLKHLLASHEVWLLANGGAKAEIIKRAAHGRIDPSVPASLLRNHQNSWLIVDREAGEGAGGTAPSRWDRIGG